MNYNDSILENKSFKFVKQLMYNIALAVCLMLVIGIILVTVFKYTLLNVESDSEYPYFKAGDMVAIQAKQEYYVGDIIQFTQSGDFPVAHRLIGKVEDSATHKTYYICHGDAVGSANPANQGEVVHWEEDADYVATLDYAAIKNGDAKNVQVIEKSAINGKIVLIFSNFGSYFNFIKEHAFLLITIVVSIWCVAEVIQNEIDIKKARRLEA